MTANEGQLEAGSGSKNQRAGEWLEGLRYTAWMVPSVAVLVVVLFIIFGHAGLSESWRRLVNSLVYSASIAVPSGFLLTWVSHRYSQSMGRWIYLLHIAILLTTATAGSFVASVVLASTGMIPHTRPMAEWRESYPIALMITLLVGLCMTTYETLRYRLQAATIELRTRQIEQERAYKLLAEARLSSLESRIQPHFLFNTLNSIAALIPSDPRRAEDTVAKLASLLRFSLAANPSGLIPLARELKVVRDYLEIEATRFGRRLRYEIGIPDDLLGIEVPPHSLATLVENVVKHVVSQRPEGAQISVQGTRKDASILLYVADNGPGFSLDAISPEHGLGNLVARLELLFGGRAALRVARRDNRTVVSLEFPAGEAS